MIEKRRLVALSIAAVFILASIIIYQNSTKALAQEGYQASNLRIFLKIDTIMGESVDQTHMDWIEIETFSWGENQSSSGTGGLAAGVVKMKDFRFSARFSRASPKLFTTCASGRIIKYAILALQTSVAGVQVDYLKWYFTEVTITSYASGAKAYEDSTPVDQFSIAFGKIGVEYRQILPDGTLNPPIIEGWDLKANKPWTPVIPSP